MVYILSSTGQMVEHIESIGEGGGVAEVDSVSP
jgi:hypothetical protein